jgi:orotate phosphoribosyltransferase
MSADDRSARTERELCSALSTARGHFLYESGHHGDLWLDLHALFVDAARVRAWALEIARRTSDLGAEIVCGPMVGGAFLAQALAAELGAGFVFAERVSDEAQHYRVPTPLRGTIGGRRLLLVDDAVNAGFAWRSTLTDLDECGARVVGLAALVALGEGAAELARHRAVPLAVLAQLERGLWSPEDCPLCRAGVPLAFPLLATPR